jgi:hypothetical protein
VGCPALLLVLQPEEQVVEADPMATDSGAYGQVTFGFQSANIPAGLCFQIHACIR